jgi:hypothetical protein
VRHYHILRLGRNLLRSSHSAPVSGCEFRRTMTGSNGTKTEACPTWGIGFWLRGSSLPESTIRTEIMEARTQHIPGVTHKTNGRPVLAGRSRMAQLINAVIGQFRK